MKKILYLLTTFLVSCPVVAQANDLRKVIQAHDCLSAQGIPVAISQNIMQISSINHKGISSGTGWIVADSSDAVNPYNRIITAKHVIVSGDKIGISSSDGTFLGEARALSKSTTGLSEDEGTVAVTNDLAVLEMIWLSPEGQKIFPSLPGLPIARIQSPGLMHGDFSNPAGIDHGASGSPLINSNGEVVGVMTQIPEIVGEHLKRINATNERWNATTRTYDVVEDTIELPVSPTAWADSLASDDATFAIGMAGVGITTHVLNEDVIVPAFPERVCVVYHGHIKTK